MIIKSDIFYSFGNSRSTFPYFFLTESLNQAYKRFQNKLPVVVLRLFFHSYAKTSECMKFRNRSIYVYILKNMYEAKRDGNANMIRRIGVITLFASHGI